MGGPNVERLLVGRVAGRNTCKNTFVRELQDGINELVRLDEMPFVKIHSVNLRPARNLIVSTREARRIQVDRLSISKAVIATAMHELCSGIAVELLGSDDPTSRDSLCRWKRPCETCGGLNWALLTAAALGDVHTITALQRRSSNSDGLKCMSSRGLDIAASQGNFDAVVAFLRANVDPNGMGSCEGHRSNYSALARAGHGGHVKIVDLLLEPIYGVQRKGSAYRTAVVLATRGCRVEDPGRVDIIRSLLVKGEFADIRKLHRDILHEAIYLGREDVVRMVVEYLPCVRVRWRNRQPLQMAVDRGYKNIAQILIEHGA